MLPTAALLPEARAGVGLAEKNAREATENANSEQSGGKQSPPDLG